MGKKIRWMIMAAALLVFLGSGGAALVIHGRYQTSRQSYTDAAAAYTQPASPDRREEGGQADGSGQAADSDRPPITVDFQKLQADNPEVAAWLYCAGTAIDYPVVQGGDNDFYLHHNYAGGEDQSGAIFLDAQCASGFADANSIIYGHSMNDGSMFGGLEAWKSQEYYEAHPVMWLLTPEANYRVRLFSGYTTSARSDTYAIYRGAGEDFSQYLSNCRDQSDFSSEAVLDGEGRYVVLSTCAYAFDEARYVLHGMLEKVDTR